MFLYLPSLWVVWQTTTETLAKKVSPSVLALDHLEISQERRHLTSSSSLANQLTILCGPVDPHRGLWARLHCGPGGWPPSSSIWACAWPAGRCSPSEWCCRWSLCRWTLLKGTCTASAAPGYKNTPGVCVIRGCRSKPSQRGRRVESVVGIFRRLFCFLM